MAIAVDINNPLAGLSASEIRAVREIAGDDTDRQAFAVARLRQLQANAAPPPAASADPPAAPINPRRAEYDALKKTNPRAAQLYASEHEAEIWPNTPPTAVAPPPALPIAGLSPEVQQRIQAAGADALKQLEVIRTVAPEWELSNRRAVWQALKAAGRKVEAAEYLEANAGDIYR